MEKNNSSRDFSLLPRPPKRRRNQRTVYSVEQLAELEKFFHTNRYPSYAERETLAARLNLQEQQVQVWFKNRRAKETRLQRATRREQPGPKAQASSQGPEVCASGPPPASAAAGPGFAEDPELPWDLLLSLNAVVSGDSELPGGTGFDDPFQGVAAAQPSASSPLQAPQGPPQDTQGPVPAAAAPAEVPDFPEIRTDLHFWSELDFTDLLSP